MSLAKGMQVAGLVFVLAGLVLSIVTGMEEAQGFKSMWFEIGGLLLGGLVFLAGRALEARD